MKKNKIGSQRPPQDTPTKGRDPRTPDYSLVVDLVASRGASKIPDLRAGLPAWTTGQINRAVAQAVRDGALVRKGRGPDPTYELGNSTASQPAATPVPAAGAVLHEAWWRITKTADDKPTGADDHPPSPTDDEER